MEELVGVGEEGARLGEHLCVGRPSQPLVALRTVGGHREVVRPLSPDGVRYQLVHHLVARHDGARLQVFGYRGHGDGAEPGDAHLVGGRDREVPVAEECTARPECLVAVTPAEGVFQPYPRVCYPQVGAVHAPLRTVHAPALGAVAVVEQLTGQTGEHGALLGTEREVGHGGGILSEVHHQCLAAAHHHLLVGGKLAFHHHASVFFVTGTADVAPHVSLCGAQRQVVAEIHLGSVRGQNLAFELGILLGRRQQVGGEEPQLLPRVILLAVEDARMLHRTSDARLPVVEVGAQQFGAAVGVGQLQHAAEGTFLSHHPLVAIGRDDLVGPPSGSHLHGQQVLRLLP